MENYLFPTIDIYNYVLLASFIHQWSSLHICKKHRKTCSLKCGCYLEITKITFLNFSFPTQILKNKILCTIERTHSLTGLLCSFLVYLNMWCSAQFGSATFERL